jgi:hypothetical protein
VVQERDDGFVEVEDPDEMAAGSGYATGTRHVRTWREKLDELQRLGFIRIKPNGTQKYRYILLLHPHDVVQRIRHETPDKMPKWWWSYFSQRLLDIRADLRWTPASPKAPPIDATMDDFEDFPGVLQEATVAS